MLPSLETSFGTQGPTPNAKIQGRGKTGDISTTTLPTDTPIGGNALDDTLDTGKTIPQASVISQINLSMGRSVKTNEIICTTNLRCSFDKVRIPFV